MHRWQRECQLWPFLRPQATERAAVAATQPTMTPPSGAGWKYVHSIVQSHPGARQVSLQLLNA